MAKHDIQKQFPSYQRIKDNLRLLLSSPEFNERVREIRAHLLLPLEGFGPELEDRDGQCQEWHEEFYRRSDEVSDAPEFWAELRRYKEMLDAGEITRKEHGRLHYELHDRVPINYFTRSVQRLAEEFNAPANYLHSIRHYILFNEATWAPMQNFAEIRDHSHKGENTVTLKFYTKLTDNDLKYIKNYVNNFAGKNLPEFYPLHDIDAKIAAERYYLNRDVRDEVEQKPYRLSSREIAENVEEDTGKKIPPGKVYDAVRSLKRARDKRFKKKSEKSES